MGLVTWLDMNTAEFKKIFLENMTNKEEVLQIKTEFHDRDFIAKALGIYPKKQDARSRKALDKIKENLEREGFLVG